MKISILFLSILASFTTSEPGKTPYPVLFVTQVPVHGGLTVTHSFDNHEGSTQSAPRGGDLMIQYPDGSIRNLTREAGFGEAGVHQGDKSIAVRQPTVHWSGKKAVFSMVIGSAKGIWDTPTYYWQLYEITGLDKGETAVISKIAGQPENYNNVAPVYGSDDNIIFASDLPITQKRLHYPPLDEYENMRVVTGLWKLDRASGKYFLMEHSPSGSFDPFIDTYGRIIFTRWDHLQRDQQADADRKGHSYGTFNWSAEDETGVPTPSKDEVFPEIRDKSHPQYNPDIALHNFNQFFPWELNQDGTEEETVNHVGRHEWGGAYTEGAFLKDKNLQYIIRRNWVENQFSIRGSAGFFQMSEDPATPGVYYAVNAPEFGVETAGQIVKFNGGPGENPEKMVISALSHNVTSGSTEDGKTPDPRHVGKFRSPLVLFDGQMITSHSRSTFETPNSARTPDNRGRVPYDFRLKFLRDSTYDGGTYKVPGARVTKGFFRELSWYNGSGVLVTQADTLWELDAREVRAKAVPPYKTETKLAAPERNVFDKTGVNESAFRAWLKERNLALIISRDITTRDRNDKQQPYNLKVTDGTQSIPVSGDVYEVKYMQLFQADLLRGQGGAGGHTTPRPGRRVLAQPMHAVKTENVPAPDAPSGSVNIAPDGSVAAIVPAQRAMSWQLTSPTGDAVVRERYWLTFQPGEIRTCASCHGINQADHLGQPKPQNDPKALEDLLNYWKTNVTANESADVSPDFSLVNAFPNPFNGQTSIQFALTSPAKTTIQLFDASGRKVQTVAERFFEGQTTHHVRINADQLATGVYYVRVDAGKTSKTIKIALVR
jgi:hypothetical protein